MDAKERIARALDAIAVDLGWSDTKIAAESGVTAQSIKNYRARKSEPSASVYQQMRERIPGFAAIVDSKAAA